MDDNEGPSGGPIVIMITMFAFMLLGGFIGILTNSSNIVAIIIDSLIGGLLGAAIGVGLMYYVNRDQKPAKK